MRRSRWPDEGAQHNRAIARGMRLAYIAPTLRNGSPVVDRTAIDREADKCKTAVILYVIGDAPSLNYLTTYISKQWSVKEKPELFFHKKGYYVTRFKDMEDRNQVLYSGPYTILTSLL